MIETLFRFASRRRRLTLVLWALLAVGGGWAASGLGDALSRSFDAPGRAAFAANERIAQEVGSGGPIAPYVAVVHADGDLRDGRGARQLAAAERALADAVPGARTLSDPRDLVADDGRTAAVLVFPPVGRPVLDENPRALAAVRAAAGDLEVLGAPVHVTGIEALADDDGRGGGPGLLIETLIGGVGALLVLAFVFASRLAFLPLVIAAASILTTFLVLRGLAAVTDVSFVVQFLVALIGLGVAIDYSLLVVVRWREARAAGEADDAAVLTAMRTGGRAAAVSGVTVAIGLLALVVVPVPFIRSIGFGGLLIPLVSVLAALTLLPALLLTVGTRLDARHYPERDRAPGRKWTAWTRRVVARRWLAAGVGLVCVGALASQALELRPGAPAATSLSAGGEASRALGDLGASSLGAAVLKPVELLGDAPADVAGVRAVLAPDGDAWRVGNERLRIALLDADPSTSAGQAALDRLRDRDGVTAAGPAAQDADLTDAIYGSLPLMVVVISLITFALLWRALRSVLLPLKAIALNFVSIAAAFGVVVIVWQHGHGSELIGGVPGTDSVTGWVPLAMFAFLYGLSMDYEVFILARMREEYDRTGDTREAVVAGLGRTGRLVTSAALILFLAFVALAATPQTEVRILATGLAAGILLDATVVRALIVPALVALFDRANWWTPGWARWGRVPTS